MTSWKNSLIRSEEIKSHAVYLQFYGLPDQNLHLRYLRHFRFFLYLPDPTGAFGAEQVEMEEEQFQVSGGFTGIQ